MDIAVVGSGHVGLITALTMSSLGHAVVATDTDVEKIEGLTRGVAPFHENGLSELLEQHLANGRVRFTAEAAEALRDADAVFICVGTPPEADGSANIAAVETTAIDVARHARPGTVIVEKSTVPAGTAERLKRALDLDRPDGGFEVVSNPEFLREGTAIQDSLRPERILVGSDSERGFEVMRQVYRPLIDDGVRVIETDIHTAELAKHACNAFLSLKISFANGLARVSELAGADVVRVAEIMGADSRIGRPFLDAGIGYGGYCFPKDLAAFERFCASIGYDFPLLKDVAALNEQAAEAGVAKVGVALRGVEGKRIALLGLSYKAGTDDVRFSPSLEVARRLLSLEAQVIGHDPMANAGAKSELPGLAVVDDVYEAIRGADCLLLATAWDEYRRLDLERVRSLLASPVVVDGRNLFDPAEMRRLGFTYYPTGRRPVVSEPAGSP
jgi:UDPglucose 6-dehydrogenase